MASLDFPIPKIMGIINVTPDSFSGDGLAHQVDKACHQALEMVAVGADLLDIGGESTRPGASPISIDEELSRVIPVITVIRQQSDIPLSIDTRRAQVMKEVISLGIDMINDVSALADPQAIAVLRESEVLIGLMHMRGEPATMQVDPYYEDVVAEVYNYLASQIDRCLSYGISRFRLIADPGFGFGKTVKHNLKLIKELHRFKHLGVPIMIGVSRKSTIGRVLNQPVEKRLVGSLALTAYAIIQGASLIRTHDVKETQDIVKMITAITQA